MAIGIVANWNADAFYGFIRPGAGANIFVHGSSLVGTDHLVPGEQVEFDRAPGRFDKEQAVNVRPLRGGQEFDDAIPDDAGLDAFLDRR